MSVTTSPVAEIQTFVDDVRFNSPLSDQKNNKTFSNAYRYVHALLIWNHVLSKTEQKKINPTSMLQFNELLSDLASAQFLLLAGMYKPARMMLRSSVENMLRVIAHEHGFLTGGAKFTYQLITLVKSSQLGAENSPVKTDIHSIINEYSILCSYTHAASETHMALRIPFNELMQFNKDEFNRIVKNLKLLSINYNRIMYSLYRKNLKNIHHKQKDFILDALPKKLKSHFSEID